MKVSYSKYSTYLSCPMKHHLSYIQCIKPKGIVRPLTFGKQFHELLENRGDVKKLKELKKQYTDEFYELPGREQSILGDDYIDDLFTIFNDYRRVYSDEKLPDITEHEFRIRMGKVNGEVVTFHGFIDEIYTKDLIRPYVGEHKTFSRRPSMDTLIMNVQSNLYAKAYQIETGILPYGVKWDYIHSAPASSPIWLKANTRHDGKFSEALNQKITPFSWNRAGKIKAKELGWTKKQYEEHVRRGQVLYGENVSNFFFRQNVEYIQGCVDNIWSDFKNTCKHMVKNQHTNKTKNITYNCGFCQFRPICHAEFSGNDTSYIIEKDFEYFEREDK